MGRLEEFRIISGEWDRWVCELTKVGKFSTKSFLMGWLQVLIWTFNVRTSRLWVFLQILSFCGFLFWIKFLPWTTWRVESGIWQIDVVCACVSHGSSFHPLPVGEENPEFLPCSSEQLVGVSKQLQKPYCWMVDKRVRWYSLGYLAVPPGHCWMVWNEWNNWIFENRVSSLDCLYVRVFEFLLDWASISKEFDDS